MNGFSCKAEACRSGLINRIWLQMAKIDVCCIFNRKVSSTWLWPRLPSFSHSNFADTNFISFSLRPIYETTSSAFLKYFTSGWIKLRSTMGAAKSNYLMIIVMMLPLLMGSSSAREEMVKDPAELRPSFGFQASASMECVRWQWAFSFTGGQSNSCAFNRSRVATGCTSIVRGFRHWSDGGSLSREYRWLCENVDFDL